MFDNPNKELQRLQERLLAAEREPSVPPAQEDADKALADVKKILARDDWENKPRQPLSRNYMPYADVLQDVEEPEEPEEKGKHTTWLWVALMLELTALAGVLIWWLICSGSL